MNLTTVPHALQQPILEKFERIAAKVAGKYQTKFQELTKAHRRDRFIEWISYSDDSNFFALESEYKAACGECEPDDLSFDGWAEKVAEWHYDRLSDDGIRAVEKDMRREMPDHYFDDSDERGSVHYFSDDMLALRNKWSRKVSSIAECARELVHKQFLDNCPIPVDNPDDDPEEAEYNRQFKLHCDQRDAALRIITNVKMKSSPAVFNCDTCGKHAYSHDETGHMIADIGMWTLSTGEAVSYLVCEKCADKPEVTRAILERMFVEREYFWRVEEERKQQELEAILRSEGIDPDTGDSIDPQPDPTDSGQTGQSAGTGSQSTHTGHFKFWRYDEFMQRPPKTWKIENIIGDRDLVTVFGEAGSGKTFIVIDLIYSACMGLDWVREYDPTNSKPGKFKITRPMTVAYCFGEGGAGLPDRFRAAEKYYGKPLTDVYFVEDVPQLYKRTDPSGIDVFITDYMTAQIAGEVPALDLLIIDTQANATLGADENSSTHMAEVIANAQKAIRVLGCAVILIHHATKAGGTYRGSSVLHGAADCIIEVKKTEGGERAISLFKLKDGATWDAQKFTILAHSTPNGAYVAWEGAAAKGGKRQTNDDTVLRLLQNNPGQHYTARQVNDKTGIAESTARNILGRLTGKGLVVNDTIQRGNSDVSVWYFDLT